MNFHKGIKIKKTDLKTKFYICSMGETKYYYYFIIIVGLLLNPFKGFSQEKNLWSKVSALEKSEKILIKNDFSKERKLFALDVVKLKNKLNKTSLTNEEHQIVEFPNADGKILKYKVFETSILHPDLAKKHPSIKTYAGQAVDNKLSSIHFTVNSLGVYAMILSPEKGTVFIDPYTKDRKKYSVYYKKDASTDKEFSCFTESSSIASSAKKSFKDLQVHDLKLRTFRLAIATTEEYSSYHIAAAGLGAGSSRSDQVNAVLSAITVTMTRVNPIFERDVALTMQLIANNDQLIFLASDPGADPYTNDDGPAMISQNKTTLNNIIGTANYDIGHVFSTGGGGVANLASVCTTSKAGGVTGSEAPVGDGFDIDFVIHELGHQFGANHTFNGTSGNCSGANRNDATAVEPGSGSTIMAYASLCTPQNVQGSSDAYFHSVSIKEITNNIFTGNSQCAVVSGFATNLNVPTANAGNDFTIPKSTPFVLKGQGFDADGNTLTYCWEQTNNEVTGIQIPPSTTQTVGAIFRSYPPTVETDRYFPSLSSLTMGSATTWEVLPSVSRTVDFSLTVRDNVVGEGETAVDYTRITINDQVGPFVVTSQNTAGISWTENDTESITWDVAGTDANGINESNVNILMSTDGGLTFPIVLASNTPNDGSESIIVPNNPSPNVRIMVQAVGNIFFAVNSENISIGSFETICSTYQATDIPKTVPDANPNGVESVINVSDDFVVSDVNLTLDMTHSWLWDLQIYLKAPNGSEVLIYDRSCGSSGIQRQDVDAVFDDEGTAAVCNNSIPAISGVTKSIDLLSILNGGSSQGDWVLRVVDNSSGDVGVINGWAIELCQTSQTSAINDFSFRQLLIYPNPFNDLLRISLETETSDDVLISLFDLQGRQVIHGKYTNQSTIFTKELNLSNLTSGIYILSIQKGLAKTSKKIIKY